MLFNSKKNSNIDSNKVNTTSSKQSSIFLFQRLSLTQLQHPLDSNFIHDMLDASNEEMRKILNFETTFLDCASKKTDTSLSGSFLPNYPLAWPTKNNSNSNNSSNNNDDNICNKMEINLANCFGRWPAFGSFKIPTVVFKC